MAIYNADANGHAPKNATVGDIINTKGGTFRITSGSNGNFQSVKVTNDPIDKELYNTLALSQSIADSNSARSQLYAREQMDFQKNQQIDMMKYNSAEAQANRDWQTEMSNTAHQREVKDLQAAGLNPVLSANNGASVGSGATASGTAMSGASGSVDEANSIKDLATALLNAKVQLEMNEKNNLTSLKMAETNAAASMYGANAVAGASMYGANMGYRIQSEFPQGIYGMANSIAHDLGYSSVGQMASQIFGDSSPSIYSDGKSGTKSGTKSGSGVIVPKLHFGMAHK